MNGTIYKILSKNDPTKFYIGATKNYKYRKQQHISLLIKNKHYNNLLQNHCNMYGIDDLYFKVIGNESDYFNLYEKETKLIKSLQPYFNHKWVYTSIKTGLKKF